MELSELLQLSVEEVEKLSFIERMTYYTWKYEIALSEVKNLIRNDNSRNE